MNILKKFDEKIINVFLKSENVFQFENFFSLINKTKKNGKITQSTLKK